MIKILFVCLGNICRSPMAEFIMKDLIKKEGLEDKIYIESAATSDEEHGNPVYPPARQMLESHGISCKGKYARQMTKEDYDSFDLLIGMDESNIRNMKRICNGRDEKIHLLLDICGEHRGVADPWYTGNFLSTWDDCNKGCRALLEKIKKNMA